MADRILITDLQCEAVIGVSDQERKAPQLLEIDLDLAFPEARRTEIGETADYREIVESAREVASGEDRRLLEHLGEDIAVTLRERFEAEAVTVRIRKPGIAAKYGLGTIGVEISR